MALSEQFRKFAEDNESHVNGKKDLKKGKIEIRIISKL